MHGMPRRMARGTAHVLAVGFVLTAGFLAVGCGAMPAGSADTFGVDFSPPACESQPSAIVFIVDGLNAAVFGEMLQAGELPAIRTYFVDRGAYAPRAVANVPSATLPNLTSLVSGRFVGHHDVVGIRVFDRRRSVYRQYDTIAQKNRVDGDSSPAAPAPPLRQTVRSAHVDPLYLPPCTQLARLLSCMTLQTLPSPGVSVPHSFRPAIFWV